MPDTSLKIQQKRGLKTARIPIKVVQGEPLRKPEWIRVRAGGGERFMEIKRILREKKLHTVCEEASCPNIGECFGHGTATFMIMGDLCTRRCPFCDVAHGRPQPLDADEPRHLGETIAKMRLKYVVLGFVAASLMSNFLPPVQAALRSDEKPTAAASQSATALATKALKAAKKANRTAKLALKRSHKLELATLLAPTNSQAH